MIDVVVLAASLVSKFLVPYLTHGLVEIGEAAAGTLAESTGQAAAAEVGDRVANVTKRIWDKVASVFKGKPEDEPLFAAFEEHPREMADMIAIKLAEILADRPDDAAELEKLSETPVPGTTTNTATVIANSGISTVQQDIRAAEGAIVAGVYRGPSPLRGPAAQDR